MEVVLTPGFCAAFPDGIFGFLAVRGCPNRPASAALPPALREIEARLRARFPGEAIAEDPVARAYAAYFRRYGTRYPVIHQVRSILSGRPIEAVSALVAAMFAAEVDSLVLTSGHDLHALAGPLRVDAAQDADRYVKINGKEQAVKPGDMVVRDAEGIIACVLYGPDSRTRLRTESEAALFCAWAPAGLSSEEVRRHLDGLASLLRLEWPQAAIEPPRLLCTSSPGQAFW